MDERSGPGAPPGKDREGRRYTRERLMEAGALGYPREVVGCALPEGTYTLEAARKRIKAFLSRKVCD